MGPWVCLKLVPYLKKNQENGPNDVHQIPGVRPVGRLPVFSESLCSMFVPLMNMKSMMHAEVS